MNCAKYQFEMHSYSDRDERDPGFAGMLAHVNACATCGLLFLQMRERDRGIATTMRAVMPPPGLEQRILTGWQHTRLGPERRVRRFPFSAWQLVAAMMVLAGVIGWKVYWQRTQAPTPASVARAAVALTGERGRLQYETPDRASILAWAGNQTGTRLQLAPNLDRVQFRGAKRVQIAQHRAVLLAMRYERRAALVVLPGFTVAVPSLGPQLFNWNHTSAAVWSDAHQTYALIFAGSQDDLNQYMHRMGIVS
ncbi:MAG: hypothetical protein ACYC6M_08920 [Terriglobales bacterium]